MGGPAQEFDIGFVMAGAISAGAYTAGAIDFFVEALEAWEAAKSENERGDLVPDHKVCIKAMSGASAGAMVTAIFVRSLVTGITHLGADNQPPDEVPPGEAFPSTPFKNPFYAAWVQCIDIEHLLKNDDLNDKSSPVVSLLDSTVLEKIGDDVLDPPVGIRDKPPAYVANPLPIFFTTTNLRGVPYGLSLDGQSQGYKHMMTAHADHVRFNLKWNGEGIVEDEAGIPLDASQLSTSGDWGYFMLAALASGAFPIGLAPRLLRRDKSDYANRSWRVPEAEPLKATSLQHNTTVPGPSSHRKQLELLSSDDPHVLHSVCATDQPIVPSWQVGEGTPTDNAYEYWNVDGGVMNNEPLELTRRALSGGGRNDRKGTSATKAVIMIDPFPNVSNEQHENSMTLVGTIWRLLSTFKAQARFKPDELKLAADQTVHSRFIISPIYVDQMGKVTGPAITSDTLGGFGGFYRRSSANMITSLDVAIASAFFNVILRWRSVIRCLIHGATQMALKTTYLRKGRVRQRRVCRSFL